MQSLLFILAAVVALLTPGFSWSFPGTFPIVRRESIEPGSPLYECHANCGMYDAAPIDVFFHGMTRLPS
ncbi:hypothetical protein ASPTUDRAFT_51604 [Aspergillus tubingensis CBS 134.48]|uniref:Uncharacterized protein n=1 Tax=Aspergillus tubingensis (strain CBS 134.48) TaxID=767770 RepID=A0A1L9NE37_ASPTC|nr:hypothetical protein ASPTUDRAFT_51604 [Aspergillus tubingensis CBS 134.48]